jgi:DNA-binding IclR family transcriptional regulator
MRDNGIQVISRAAQIMRSLSAQQRGLTLSEIAENVGLPRSTVHRIISALAAEGLTVAVSPAGGYRLGPEFIRLAEAERGELRKVAHPYLEQLSADLSETVDLAVLVRDHVSFVDQVAAPQRLRAVSSVGASFPAHCTANGKVLLAQHDDDYLRKLLPPKLAALTPNTVTDREELLRQLADVRADGVGYDREEHTLGICAVGAPVRDAYGVVAALTVPLPTQRFVGHEAELAAHVREACDRLSTTLGAE